MNRLLAVHTPRFGFEESGCGDDLEMWEARKSKDPSLLPAARDHWFSTTWFSTTWFSTTSPAASSLSEAFAKLSENIQERKQEFARISELTAKVRVLERAVGDLKEHCKKLGHAEIFSVPVETLSPEPFVVKRAFQVVVRPSDGEFIATIFDANLGMTGDTAEEAVANLKTTIADTFDLFEENEATLGPEPMRQLAVLRELIQRRK